MQPSDLSFPWLKIIEQSIIRKQLMAKAQIPLLQVLAPKGEQLPLCDRIIDCFPDIPAHCWLDKLVNQNLAPSEIQNKSYLWDTSLVSLNLVTSVPFYQQIFQ